MCHKILKVDVEYIHANLIIVFGLFSFKDVHLWMHSLYGCVHVVVFRNLK